MVKQVYKRPAVYFALFPAPKKGEGRMLVKTEAKRKKDNGDWNKIKYVPVKKQIKKKNRAREVWHRSLLDYMSTSQRTRW